MKFHLHPCSRGGGERNNGNDKNFWRGGDTQVGDRTARQLSIVS